MEWQWSKFGELSRSEIYEAMVLRQRVFVVEQNCAYLDADGWDYEAWHLFYWRTCGDKRRLEAYMRVLSPGVKFREPAISRVIVAPEARRQGMGKILLNEGIRRTLSEFGQTVGIRISAQAYLERFYTEAGFKTVSEPYQEDGIPHVEMLF